ncbi:unnamed protein product [Cuscuta epithymum]|uniref:Uncharacterized protein n=1 Tax=Cuscuta epithymum TaxID=186058 RepID=A0AAV0EM05_9ASTE|nr:unnamed protein product [Cuscuta epithymum]
MANQEITFGDDGGYLPPVYEKVRGEDGRYIWKRLDLRGRGQQQATPPPVTSPYRLGSTKGCFRKGYLAPLSELQELDYPWGGYVGVEKRFCRKYSFEDDESKFDPGRFYGRDPLDVPVEEPEVTFEEFMRFLKQVRESKGYDVDCQVPICSMGRGNIFIPITDLPELPSSDPDFYQDAVLSPVLLAIQHINQATGKNYKLLEIIKAVETSTYKVYVTFTAKEAEDDDEAAAPTTFQAIVCTPPGSWPKVGPLLEWRFKPDLSSSTSSSLST